MQKKLPRKSRSSVPHCRWPSCHRRAIIHAICVTTRVAVGAVGSSAPRDSCEGVRANHKPKHAAAHERNPSFPPYRPPTVPPASGRRRHLSARRRRCPRPRWRSVSRDRPRPAIIRAQSLEAGAASEPRRGNLVSSSAGVEEDLQQKDPVVGNELSTPPIRLPLTDSMYQEKDCLF